MSTRLFVAAAAAAAAIAQVPSSGLAPGDPAAVVQFGSARFTVLTDRLLRMEYSSTRTFDDRATLTAINRQLPVPSFTVTHPNASAVTITTSALVLTYVDGGAAPPNASCAAPLPHTDRTDGSRVPQYPDGIVAQTTDECCAACAGAFGCNAWVLSPYASPTSPNCYLMTGVTTTVNATDRTFGWVKDAGPFNPSNLRIDYTSPGGAASTWVPGTNLTNLGGTYSSLDCYIPPMECAAQYWATLANRPGFLSRDGPVVFDDTLTARRTPGDPADPDRITWPWWADVNATASGDEADWYFSAYPSDYASFFRDWRQVSGAIAMPRRSAFGLWWSRYWPYNASSIESEVLSGYANYSIPLSNLVMDMDWHAEPKDPNCSSWGNFDFNTEYFPDPQGFIQAVHNGSTAVGRPLELSLNVHPQSGVDHCDSRYALVAARMGVDPATNTTIPCDMGNKTFVRALYDIYYNADPLGGVDTWWTDYGGCGGPSTGVLLWSNTVYDDEIRYNASRNERPQVLSRNGGPGTHRYPVSFSGDTRQHESTLDFLIQTTPMAANALVPWWSHDVGGFMAAPGSGGAPGDSDPTNFTGSLLMLRWYQFAAVSPIFRTHCDHCIRTVWSFPTFPWLRDAMLLRQALVPYLYTAARAAWDPATAMPPIQPLYYTWPTGQEEAYTYTHQFMVGPSLLAAPISTVSWAGNGGPADNTTAKSVWIPPGTWAAWDGSEVFTGPAVVTRSYGFGDTPLFVSSPNTTLLPLCGPDLANVVRTSPDITWVAYAGVTGSGVATARGSVWEDDGRTLGYEQGGQGAVTAATLTATTTTMTLTVLPTQGSYPGIPATRAHSLQVRGPGQQPAPSSVTVNGQPVGQVPPASLAPGWYIVPPTGMTNAGLTAPVGSLVVNAGQAGLAAQLQVVVSW